MATSLRALPRGDGAARVVCARRGRRVVGNGRTSLRSRGFAGSGTAVLGRGNGARVFCAGWVDNKASVVVHGVPLAVVWELWQDKSRIPNWMPWIDSVVPDDKDAQCSRWILRTTQFGQDFEFSWVARDLPPVRREQIAWESTEGLQNKGRVTFAEADSANPGNNTKLAIEISYQVPDALIPFGAAVSPIVEQVLKTDLERFAVFASKVVSALGKRAGKG